jgi:hypothetical protein
MFKINKPLLFLSIIMVTMLFFTACEDRKGSLKQNNAPIISISNYFGEDSLAAADEAQLFQQTVRWNAYDTDGTVEGYAYRILDADGNPIATPGHDYIVEDASLPPEEQGWVWHYEALADESIPLNNPNAQRTIWSDEVYTVVNFPANAAGDSSQVVSRFQVKCVDNRGEESEIATKFFRAFSTTPKVRASSTKGEIDTKTIGTGVIFQFNVFGDEPYIDEQAQYFEFALAKKDLDGNVIPYDGTNAGGYDMDFNDVDTWLSTEGQANPDQYLISQITDTKLLPNTLDETGAPQDSTYLVVRAIDIAGIVSEPQTITFVVKEGFHPGSLIYVGSQNNASRNDTWVLGENHYSTYMDASISKVIPSVQTIDGTHFATPFWVNYPGGFNDDEARPDTTEYSAIWSQDLKITMRWGWHGEYQSDEPANKKVGDVLDEETDLSYFAEITHFDLRLDGAPFEYAPLPAVGENLQIDEDGTEWLRVPIGHEISQGGLFTGDKVTPGSHTVEVRAVDLQGVYDPTPATFTYKIAEPVVEKSGILVIDDDTAVICNQDSIAAAYDYILADQPDVDYTSRKEVYDYISSVGLAQLHFDKAVFSPVDLQSYELIIYHSDAPLKNQASNFEKEYDAFNLYLASGGNMIYSGGANIQGVQENCQKDGIPLLQKYFGIPLVVDNGDTIVNTISNENFLSSSFFVKANAVDGFTNDIQLAYPNPITQLVNLKYGLNAVSYFTENYLDAFSETTFTLGCKEPNADGNGFDPTFTDWDDADDTDQYPSQAQFDELQGQTVGVKKVTANNSCYLFGFPLSFMDKDQAKTAVETIISEIQ